MIYRHLILNVFVPTPNLFPTGDKQSTGDIKAMEKGTALLKGCRILACSVQIKEQIYLTGIVAASMKNQVTIYNISLEI